MKALLIVDVQNDFVEGGSLGCNGGKDVAVAAHQLATSGGYDLVVSSQDWHNADNDNGGHFASNNSPDFMDTWPVHCVSGTEGAEFCYPLTGDDIQYKFYKGMGKPSYSAFEAYNEDGVSLPVFLSESGVTELDVMGIATDYCVKASVLDAVNTGFTVRVLLDNCAAVNESTEFDAVREMSSAGAMLVYS